MIYEESAALDLTLSDLERSKQDHSDFEALYLETEPSKAIWNINRKPYTGSPVAPSHLTLSLKGQSQGHSDFEALYHV